MPDGVPVFRTETISIGPAPPAGNPPGPDACSRWGEGAGLYFLENQGQVDRFTYELHSFNLDAIGTDNLKIRWQGFFS